MRIARHQHVLVLLALLDELIEEHLDAIGNLFQFVACKQLQVYQYLVVARTARMNLLAHIAELARQHQFYLRVDVLDALFDDEFAPLADGIDVLQLSQKHR